jgi:hypothetical protein
MNAEIRKKVYSEVSPLNTALSSPASIVNLGPEAVEAVIELFQHPLTPNGPVNQAVLSVALVQFAMQGDRRAAAFLQRIAAGEVAVVGSYADAALGVAKHFVATSLSPE